jgi:two-component system, OmpR family, phosphate regulon sensor histidine kinase PhoR
MVLKFKKSYRFALISTCIVSSFLLVLLLLEYFFFNNFPIWIVLLVFFVFFIFSFFVIQYRVEQFIYLRIQKIYKSVTLLDATKLRNQTITTDMKTLSEELEKYARLKKLEIESLKVREEYRREFMGNVSHELKTPLFTVQNYIATLLDGAINDENVKIKYLQRADKGVERLIYIVEDLDMISKLELGEVVLDKTDFDIVKLVKTVFDMVEIQANNKNITLGFDISYKKPIWVYADEGKIQQVLTNLIVNSIKYGKKKGTTEVSIEQLTEKKVIIRVTDNGEGIEKKNMSRIFERFYRVDKSGSRDEGGSGLGLSIVKHIIESHQEKIYVESQFKIGSEFSFTLEKGNE